MLDPEIDWELHRPLEGTPTDGVWYVDILPSDDSRRLRVGVLQTGGSEAPGIHLDLARTAPRELPLVSTAVFRG